ncbi:MAG: STAS domain-containing protein [Betaproteobacteria bacterium]|nr:STAS domain-containing protein [Betaproteobacteria bacterium]
MRDFMHARTDQPLTLARLEGRLDCAGIERLRRQCDGISVPSDGGLLLDFSDVTFVDSMAMGCVAALARRVRGNGAELALFGVSERVRRSFEIAGLHQILDIVPDEASARQVLR